MHWQSIDSAPKNRPVLLDVGLPWAVFGIYNAESNEWVFADLQAEEISQDVYSNYFQNEYEKTPVSWCELPNPVDVK